MINFEPTYDRVVVEPIVETVSSGGIILTNHGTMEIMKGKVVAVGPGHLMPTGKFRTGENKVGDIVHYLEPHALKLNIEGKVYHVLKDADPIGKLLGKAKDANVIKLISDK